MKKLLLVLSSLFFAATAYGQTVYPVVHSSVYPVVYSVTSTPWESGPIVLDLTSTNTINTFLTTYSGTYARSSTMWVPDFEGIYREIPTNTVPIYGARQVQNLAYYSEDISNAAWDRDGASLGATEFQAQAQFDRFRQVIDTKDSNAYTLSFFASVPTGANTTGYKFYTYNSASGNVHDLTLSNATTRYSITVLGKSGGGSIGFGVADYNTSDWAVVSITNLQVENVTGATNQAPSEYIATITAPTTKYYNTENGNTVASNVVTEADGAALTNVIGAAFWPTTTNVVGSAQYRDFTHADWNATDCSITAGAVTLIDGTSVSDKNTLTASGANATFILDPYTSASGVHSGGFFIKRKTGTGTIEVTIDGGTTWVDVTSQVDADTAWHLCQTTLPTVTDPELGVRLVTSGDAVYLDWAQMDDGNERVGVFPIEGGTTLSKQLFMAVDASNASRLIKNKQGYIIGHVQLLPDDVNVESNARIVANGGDGRIIYLYQDDNNRGSSFDGTNLLRFNNSLLGYTKIASYWWGLTMQISSNGSSSSTGSYDGDWDIFGIFLGSNEFGDSAFNGIISKVIFGPGIKTTQAEMEDETVAD